MITLRRTDRSIMFITSDLLSKKVVHSSLTYAVPGVEFSRKFKNSKWDGLYRFYDSRLNTFDYGMLNVVTKALNRRGVKWQLEADFPPISLKGVKLTPKLWDHQIQAIKAFCARPFGRVEFPTRTGKTVFAGELIRIINKTTLFVVDTQDLLQQAIGDISNHLKIPKEKIGKIGEDDFRICKFTVATVQTVQKLYYGSYKTKDREKRRQFRERRNQLLELFRNLKFLIVDECHEHGSKDRTDMYKSIKGCVAYLALSASHTKSEDPLKNVRLQECFGDIVFRADQQELKDKNILAHETVMLIMMDHNKNANLHMRKKDGYDTYEERIIINNTERNNVIVNITECCRKLALKTLVMFQYRNHAKQIYQITGDDYISGDDKLERRTAARKQFLRRKGGVLLVTKIFKKGITLPEAEVLFNAGGGLEQSDVIQEKGRVLGVKGDKNKALIIDFVDIYKYFDRHSLSRIEVYERHAGLENIVVFDFSDENFYNDVKEFLQTWKDTPSPITRQ